MNFIIVRNENLVDFEKEVNKKRNQGYEVYGDLKITRDRYFQTMVKVDQEYKGNYLLDLKVVLEESRYLKCYIVVHSYSVVLVYDDPDNDGYYLYEQEDGIISIPKEECEIIATKENEEIIY